MKVSSICTIFALASCVLSTGCSTLTGERMQSISVESLDKTGANLTGANCEMKNDEGKWFLVTPGSTMIHRSNKDLNMVCKKEDHEDGTARIISKVKGSMFGNIVFGGGVGAIIDHNNGSAYQYPTTVQVKMGENRVIDSKSKPESPAATEPSEKAAEAPK